MEKNVYKFQAICIDFVFIFQNSPNRSNIDILLLQIYWYWVATKTSCSKWIETNAVYRDGIRSNYQFLLDSSYTLFFFFFYIMYVISETMQIKEYLIFSLNLEFGHLTLNCQDVSFVLSFCFIIVSVDFISLSFQFFYQVLINQEKNNANSVNL